MAKGKLEVFKTGAKEKEITQQGRGHSSDSHGAKKNFHGRKNNFTHLLILQESMVKRVLISVPKVGISDLESSETVSLDGININPPSPSVIMVSLTHVVMREEPIRIVMGGAAGVQTKRLVIGVPGLRSGRDGKEEEPDYVVDAPHQGGAVAMPTGSARIVTPAVGSELV